MSFTLATWNINSVRLREGLVARLMTQEAPDVLCSCRVYWVDNHRQSSARD